MYVDGMTSSVFGVYFQKNCWSHVAPQFPDNNTTRLLFIIFSAEYALGINKKSTKNAYAYMQMHIIQCLINHSISNIHYEYKLDDAAQHHYSNDGTVSLSRQTTFVDNVEILAASTLLYNLYPTLQLKTKQQNYITNKINTTSDHPYITLGNKERIPAD